tara:strand:+ start:1028 stop:1129 length:102 start_codon:yes stop_codon:yes gene_type:complete
MAIIRIQVKMILEFRKYIHSYILDEAAAAGEGE